MSGRRSLVRRARDLVVDWTVHYTRGLDDRVARDRVDEVLSDLWEQVDAAGRAGRSGPRLAGALLVRAVRGAAADLSWRRARLLQERVGRGGLSLRAARRAAARIPIPLVGPPLFDQTNGIVAMDLEVVDDRDDTVLDLLGKAAASNAVNFGTPMS